MSRSGTENNNLQHLTAIERQALAEYEDALLAQFPDQIRRLILYGSKARGDDDEESDIDVMVVVGWNEEEIGNGFWRAMYDDPRWQAIVCLASDISLEYEVFISPHVVGQNRFRRWSPLLENILTEGVVLWSRDWSKPVSG